MWGVSIHCNHPILYYGCIGSIKIVCKMTSINDIVFTYTLCNCNHIFVNLKELQMKNMYQLQAI